ncbi:MAG: hypothetical protein IJC25_02060, partial [Clostridia bacterium]|nr:hypothetical protein [Clostridia bacterium]
MIVTMKKVSIVGLLNEQDAVTSVLQKFGRVQVIGQPQDSPKLARLTQRNEQCERIARCIEFLSRYREQNRGLLASLNIVLRELPEAQAQQLSADGPRLEAAFAKVDEYEQRLAQLRTRQSAVQSARTQLAPWEGVEIPLE